MLTPTDAQPPGAAARLILADASHIKAVPGRKTDINDAKWMADLLAQE
jgi:hypothetical protein